MREYSDEPLRPDAEAKPQPDARAGSAGRYLPLEARVEKDRDTYVARLPVRREQVTVDKQAFVVETATIRRVPVEDVERIHDTLRSEELRAEAEGDVEVVHDRDEARPLEDRESPPKWPLPRQDRS